MARRLLATVLALAAVPALASAQRTANDSALYAFSTGPAVATPTFPAPKGRTYKVAWDVTVAPDKPDGVVEGFRAPAGFLKQMDAQGVPRKNVHLAVVVHGTATRSLLQNDAYREQAGADNASIPLLQALDKAGVQVIVCGQALINRNVPRDRLLPFVKVATSAQMARAILHTEGYALFVP